MGLNVALVAQLLVQIERGQRQVAIEPSIVPELRVCCARTGRRRRCGFDNRRDGVDGEIVGVGLLQRQGRVSRCHGRSGMGNWGRNGRNTNAKDSAYAETADFVGTVKQ